MDTYLYEIEDRLYINLTNRCNNTCNFCIRNGRDGICGHKLWLENKPTAKMIIDQLVMRKNSYASYVFCGFGEPIYEIETIMEVGKFLKSQGKRVRINTNGQGNLIHGKDVVPMLVGAVDKVSISLNASNAQKYQELCNSEYGEDSFKAILDFGVKCKNIGLEVCYTVVDIIGKAEIDACQKLCDDLGIELRVRHYE